MADETGTEQQQGENGQEQQQETGEQGVKLTADQQRHVDGIIAARIKQERSKIDNEVERRAKEQVDREKMDAAQRAEAERDEARKAAEDATKGSRRAIAEARIETALLAAGVKAERIEKVARLVSVEDVAGADDAKAAAADAVRQVLADFPEFRPVVGQSGGEIGGGGGSKGPTLDEFKAMSMEERSELYTKDVGAYRALAKQEKEAA